MEKTQFPKKTSSPPPNQRPKVLRRYVEFLQPGGCELTNGIEICRLRGAMELHTALSKLVHADRVVTILVLRRSTSCKKV